MMRKGKPQNLAIGIAVLFLLMILMPVVSAGFYTNQVIKKESAKCLDCHDDMATSLIGSAHQMATDKTLKAAVEVGCIGCHEGWEKHIDEPSAENITSLPGLSLVRQAEICSGCHADPHQSGVVATDPHYRANVACLSCHTIHNNKNRSLVKDDGENFCATCHTTVAAEFKRRFVHPLESGNIRCTDCHKLQCMNDPSLTVGLDWTCQNCHSEKAGPFTYEHPVAYKHLVNGGGCPECHEPHGSPNDRLLIQPGNGLCRQCHEVPAGHRVQHSGLGTKLDCVVCHSEIHGSYSNKKLLDPDLGIKLFPDCYQSGCHNIND